MSGTSWWEDAFQEAYLEVYAHRTEAHAAAEVAGMLPRLRGPVLDAACGSARHLVALRAAGLPACGFDLSPQLLACASARAPGLLARGDLRRPPFAAGAFGTILVLFTGFGYFDDAGNAACLGSLARLLASGGRLVLDLPDPDRLVATLQPLSWRATPRGWRVEERRRITGGRVVKQVVAIPPGREPLHWQEDVRLYRAGELADMAGACGLRLVDTWEGLRGPHDGDGRLVAWLTTA